MKATDKRFIRQAMRRYYLSPSLRPNVPKEITDWEASELLKTFRLGKICNKLRNRFKANVYDYTRRNKMIEVVLAEAALRKTWKSSERGEEIQFYEMDKFHPGVDWSKHFDSIPDKLYGVRILPKSGPFTGTWIDLPLNVGVNVRANPTKHQGFTPEICDLFRQIDGSTPIIAVISGYAEKIKDPLLDDPIIYSKSLRAKNIRQQIEVALMRLLFSAEVGVVLSSILFSVRDYPVQGVAMTLEGLYAKFNALAADQFGPHAILPLAGYVDPLRRERAKLPGFNAAKDQQGSNGTVWVGYFNGRIMDLSRIPKLDYMLLLRNAQMMQQRMTTSIETLTFIRKMIELHVGVAHDRWGNSLAKAANSGHTWALDESYFSPENLAKPFGKGDVPTAHILARKQDARVHRVKEGMKALEKANLRLKWYKNHGGELDPTWNMEEILVSLWPARVLAMAARTTKSGRPRIIPGIPAEFAVNNTNYQLTLADGKFDYIHAGRSIERELEVNQLEKVPMESFTPEVLMLKNCKGESLLEVMEQLGLTRLAPEENIHAAKLVMFPDMVKLASVYSLPNHLMPVTKNHDKETNGGGEEKVQSLKEKIVAGAARCGRGNPENQRAGGAGMAVNSPSEKSQHVDKNRI